MKRKDLPGYIVFILLIFIILFLRFCYPEDIRGQDWNHRIIKEPWERTKQGLIVTAWITTDAISDAWIAQNKNQVYAHTLDAFSTSLLLTLPFTTKLNIKDAPRFISGAILIRMGLFDIVYDKTRGLPISYRTNVSLWDKALNAVNPPPSAEITGRCAFITFGFAIYLTGDYHGERKRL